MRWIVRLVAAAAVLTAGMGNAQPVPKRVALIIANTNYAGYPSLPNAATDSELVRETLARAGFQTLTVHSDLDGANFRSALAAFSESARNADVALFYYAGHGLEVSGRNWLVPVNASLASDRSLATQAVDTAAVFEAMRDAATRIVVLDACRDNPFAARLRQATSGRAIGRGLGAPAADSGLDLAPPRFTASARGSLLMYSAAPGAVADDGPRGQGSPFARAFQKHFAEPDVDLRVAVGKIADAVNAESGGRQLPFSTLSLAGVPIVFVINADRPPPPAPIVAGAEFRDCDVCPLMVVVPPGRFVMGTPDDEIPVSERLRRPITIAMAFGTSRTEQPQHPVTIARPFAAGKFEVTFDEWDACVADGGCRQQGGAAHRPDDEGWGRGRHPVINVSWQDAKSYLAWVNGKIGGRAYRLLTEAEWEYAAHALTDGRADRPAFPWGPRASHEFANYGAEECCAGLVSGRDQWEHTSPAGSFPPNAFGLHDMNANVSEWAEDCWVNSYADAPAVGTAKQQSDCQVVVYRAGDWFSPPESIRSAHRGSLSVSARSNLVGFRVARTAP